MLRYLKIRPAIQVLFLDQLMDHTSGRSSGILFSGSNFSIVWVPCGYFQLAPICPSNAPLYLRPDHPMPQNSRRCSPKAGGTLLLSLSVLHIAHISLQQGASTTVVGSKMYLFVSNSLYRDNFLSHIYPGRTSRHTTPNDIRLVYVQFGNFRMGVHSNFSRR